VKSFHYKTFCILLLILGMNSACKESYLPDEYPEEITGAEDPGSNLKPNAAIVPAVRVTSIVSISGANDATLTNPSWLLDNRGREWVRRLPINTYVVFQLSGSYSHLLFQWMSSANNNYNEIQYGAPTGYQIQVSSNSTNGSNGNWETVVIVQNNGWAARAHEIRGTNIRWIRFRVTGGGTNIDEFDIHDLSRSRQGDAVDTWAFIGDSNTAGTFWRSRQGAPHFNTQVHSINPARYPSMINFGIGGNNSGDLLARLQQTIDNNQGIYFWAVAIGTNDGDAIQFENNLKQIIETLINNGKQPIIARIAYRTDDAFNNENVKTFNRIIDRLVDEYDLPAGPNLYTYFERNPAHLRDGLHPTESDGVRAIQRLWAEVACRFATK